MKVDRKIEEIITILDVPVHDFQKYFLSETSLNTIIFHSPVGDVTNHQCRSWIRSNLLWIDNQQLRVGVGDSAILSTSSATFPAVSLASSIHKSVLFLASVSEDCFMV